MAPEPLRVLVVDDEADTETLFAQQFRRERKGNRILLSFARSGEDALALLRAGDRPDCLLILSDIHMPGMNGLALLQTVKREWPDLRVVMTALTGDESESHALELGADECVSKPIDFDELRQKVLST